MAYRRGMYDDDDELLQQLLGGGGFAGGGGGIPRRSLMGGGGYGGQNPMLPPIGPQYGGRGVGMPPPGRGGGGGAGIGVGGYGGGAGGGGGRPGYPTQPPTINPPAVPNLWGTLGPGGRAHWGTGTGGTTTPPWGRGR